MDKISGGCGRERRSKRADWQQYRGTIRVVLVGLDAPLFDFAEVDSDLVALDSGEVVEDAADEEDEEEAWVRREYRQSPPPRRR
jgi:hypothetical protein